MLTTPVITHQLFIFLEPYQKFLTELLSKADELAEESHTLKRKHDEETKTIKVKSLEDVSEAEIDAAVAKLKELKKEIDRKHRDNELVYKKLDDLKQDITHHDRQVLSLVL